MLPRCQIGHHQKSVIGQGNTKIVFYFDQSNFSGLVRETEKLSDV